MINFTNLFVRYYKNKETDASQRMPDSDKYLIT